MDTVRSTYQRSCIGGNSGNSRRKEGREAYINIVKRADIVLQYKGQRHEDTSQSRCLLVLRVSSGFQ